MEEVKAGSLSLDHVGQKVKLTYGNLKVEGILQGIVHRRELVDEGPRMGDSSDVREYLLGRSKSIATIVPNMEIPLDPRVVVEFRMA